MTMNALRFRSVSVVGLAIACGLCSCVSYKHIPAQAKAEADNLQQVFGVPVSSYAAKPGDFTVPAKSAFTADKLAGKPLQQTPPQLGEVPVYPGNQQDCVTNPSYKVTGLGNFRFKYFNNEMGFGRDHTWPMNDYSSTHGFNFIAPNERKPADITWMPTGTKFTFWSGISRDIMVKSLGIADPQRLDMLVDLGDKAVVDGLIKAGFFKGWDPAIYDELYLDLEEGCPDLDTLRAKPFYPKNGAAEERAAFEKKYYDGMAMILYCPVEAARKLGFKNISVYGWNPDWWMTLGDPATDYYWQNIGKQILPHLDWVCPSIYYTKPVPSNVAFALAYTDSNLRYINTLPPDQRKPVRPFFSNQYIHWVPWCYLAPVPNEDMRATTVLQAFTQYDGYLLWCNAVLANDQSCNANLPPPLTKDAKLEFREAFNADREGGGSRDFKRYDLITVTNVDGGKVRFQWVDPNNEKDHGIGEGYPFYTAADAALAPHLMSPFECLQGMYEGLAMAKQLEWTLRHGTIVSDFESKEVSSKLLPIERHIQAGELHVVATYDPKVVHGEAPRDVMVKNFAGVTGLNLTFPTDSQVRIYLVRVPKV